MTCWLAGERSLPFGLLVFVNTLPDEPVTTTTTRRSKTPPNTTTTTTRSTTTTTPPTTRPGMIHEERKPDFCECENKDADQLRGNREADQRAENG